jgi:hypothetical protein
MIQNKNKNYLFIYLLIFDIEYETCTKHNSFI